MSMKSKIKIGDPRNEGNSVMFCNIIFLTKAGFHSNPDGYTPP
jgi:hypothetical protein